MAKKPSIDGFIPRRSPRSIGGDYQPTPAHRERPSVDYGMKRRSVVDEAATEKHTTVGEEGLVPVQSQGLTRSDIDDSLRDIDAIPEETTDDTHRKKKWRKKSKQLKQPKSRRRRIIKWIIILIILGIVAGGGYVAFKAIIAGQAVFKGSIFGLIQEQKLKQDSHGRTNILILGTSEDDPGHQGSHLTDSIMILSIDQTKKDAYMISVPRDLEVQYGRACPAGYAGKINSYFDCINQDWTSKKAEEERQTKTREFIGNIFGIPLQYSVHVNYSVMRDVVKAIGPITVNIQGSGGAPGVMDSNFDWKCKGGNAWASRATMIKNCPPNGHFIDYPNGPATLDAEHALYLAQARGDRLPTYGLGNANFDREQNQQKIMVAIRDKALSTGTLTNVSKVTKLIDAIGNNLRTNFATSEVQTLVKLAKDIPASSIKSVNLLDAKIMTGNAQPTAGLYNYTELQAFVKKTLYATGITREGAHVMVLNAAGVGGFAQSEADKLLGLGMTIDGTDNAPADGTYPTNVIYKLTDRKTPETTKKLESMYGVKMQQVTSVPGVSVGVETDYVLILQTPGDVSPAGEGDSTQ